jgi:hypothetical protein
MALVAAVVYVVVGVAFAALDHGPASGVRPWRLAAWVVSAIAFAAHVACERVLTGRPVRAAAWHVSLAAALGGFGLAAVALLRAASTGTGKPILLAIALVAWPAIIFLPAFLVALAIAAIVRPYARSATAT